MVLPDNGRLKWYFQNAPGESLDLDEVFERVLIDHGAQKTVMTVGKSGLMWSSIASPATRLRVAFGARSMVRLFGNYRAVFVGLGLGVVIASGVAAAGKYQVYLSSMPFNDAQQPTEHDVVSQGVPQKGPWFLPSLAVTSK